MSLSIFDLFSIGMGPSSSHTVGPMRAAHRFLQSLPLQDVKRIQIDLYGSLALTGKGHGTDLAVLLGLMGELPETVDTETVTERMNAVYETQRLLLNHDTPIDFQPIHDLRWHKETFLPFHSNGVRFSAFDANGHLLQTETLYSIGGGFIVSEADESTTPAEPPFRSCAHLMEVCAESQLSIAEWMMQHESQSREPQQVRDGILAIWSVMNDSIDRGLHREVDYLPGSLKVRRRAPVLFTKLQAKIAQGLASNDMDWLSAYAIAVNEENAACKRIVTAPTNGAAGIIPAVLKYFLDSNPANPEQVIIDYLLTAAAVGFLYKTNASISAAEVGCQGEVGVACSMAAAGLAAVMGGTIAQIENAAEMGMEHHLGLTCDPIGGLVQIPCIERNAMGSVQAVNAARLALMGDGQHHVHLDKVIETMFRTGKDMSNIYKETSLGGLAVNVAEC